MSGWLKIYFEEGSCFKNIHKTQLRPQIENCTQAWAPMLRHGNWSVILRLEGIQRRVTKITKMIKDYSYRQRLQKLGLTTLLERRIKDELIETFKIIDGISNYDKLFQYFHSN